MSEHHRQAWGTDTGAAVLAERRLSILEAARDDHSRRILSLERQHSDSTTADWQRETGLTGLRQRFESFLEYAYSPLEARVKWLETTHRNVLIGIALSASGLLWQIARKQLGW
jgi:hypothetical protein